ncbi:hypothetical protein [Haloferula sargassicola]|uniref:Zinc ribbon domain-containing protein n=1 Tax=Haloferula sargassicola TaxID=490096 RepID=A0ABP9UQ52_9BACT
MPNDTPPPGQREFRCDHCHGKIHIPVDFPPTTGPCPHCGQVITSPAPVPAAPPPPAKPAVEAAPAVAAAPPAPAAETPVKASPPEAEATPTMASEELPERTDKKAPAPKRGNRSLLIGATVILFLLLAGLVLTWFLINPSTAKQGEPSFAVTPEKQEEYYLEKGWEDDARQVLGNFLAADTPVERAKYAIRGDELLPEMEKFYAGQKIDDSDTPVEAFSVFPLTIDDRKRGIFMLVYDQPPAFEMSEFFVPVVPLAVQYKVKEPDLLVAALGRATNFASQPLKVQAVFKRTDSGLKVDWETFVQTKYRRFREFLELPQSGHSEVFRVIVTETVPENREVPAGHRVYLVVDPAYRNDDLARVMVPVDSEIGRALSILNWRGTNGGRATSRTATLELGWSEDEAPQLEIERFICWEFLGVGGEALPGGGARNGGK